MVGDLFDSGEEDSFYGSIRFCSCDMREHSFAVLRRSYILY